MTAREFKPANGQETSGTDETMKTDGSGPDYERAARDAWGRLLWEPLTDVREHGQAVETTVRDGTDDPDAFNELAHAVGRYVDELRDVSDALDVDDDVPRIIATYLTFGEHADALDVDLRDVELIRDARSIVWADDTGDASGVTNDPHRRAERAREVRDELARVVTELDGAIARLDETNGRGSDDE
jgi:cell division protein ZapA (FtsZ GTPase activity inhibitor)